MNSDKLHTTVIHSSQPEMLHLHYATFFRMSVTKLAFSTQLFGQESRNPDSLQLLHSCGIFEDKKPQQMGRKDKHSAYSPAYIFLWEKRTQAVRYEAKKEEITTVVEVNFRTLWLSQQSSCNGFKYFSRLKWPFPAHFTS